MPFVKGGKVQNKRIIILSDGTWMNSDSPQPGENQQPYTNITRLSRAITSVSDKNIPQVVFYQNGVGSDMKGVARAVAGAFGVGLSTNIQEAYMFLANNYHEGDEIFLFGFSRGAYTIRSLAGLIGRIGILTKKGMEDFPRVYHDYEAQKLRDEDYVATQTDWERIKGVKIKVVGCFDTVGALGIPSTKPLEAMRKNKKYSFHDTQLTPGVENAFHAIALDEERAPFTPSIWRKQQAVTADLSYTENQDDESSIPLPSSNSPTNAPLPVTTPTVLRQVWFPGVHSNIGGGYPDSEIATMAFFWMVDQCSPFLTFDREYLDSMHECDDNSTHWSSGTIYNSFTGPIKCYSAVPRTPGGYFEKERQKELEVKGIPGVTNEEIHPSVRVRIMQTNGRWWPRSLEGWTCKMKRLTIKDVPEWRWVWYNPKTDKEIRESKLGLEEEGLAGPTMIKLMAAMTILPSPKRVMPAPTCCAMPACGRKPTTEEKGGMVQA